MSSVAEMITNADNVVFDLCVAYHSFIGHTRGPLAEMVSSGQFTNGSSSQSPRSAENIHPFTRSCDAFDALLSFFSRAGSLLQFSSGDAFSAIDADFLRQIADDLSSMPVESTPFFVPDFFLPALPLFSPRLKKDSISSSKNVPLDFQAMVEGRESEIVNNYTVVERTALQMLSSGELATSDIASVNEQYAILKKAGKIFEEKLSSRQTATVRWSITCSFYSKGAKRVMCTGLCVSLSVARLLVLIRMGNLPLRKPISKSRRRINKMSICNVGKLLEKYAEAKQLIREPGIVKFSRPSIQSSIDGSERQINIVDVSSFIAHAYVSSRTSIDPHLEYCLLRQNLISLETVSKIFSVSADRLQEDISMADPKQAIVHMIRNRDVLQTARDHLGQPGLNKDACLGLDTHLLPSGENLKMKSVDRDMMRATLRVMSALSDTINLQRSCCKDGEWKKKTFFINWCEAFDISTVLALTTIYGANCIVLIGCTETSSIGSPTCGGGTSFLVSERQLPPGTNFMSVSRIAQAAATLGAMGDVVIISGGSTQDTIGANETWAAANCLFFDAMAHNDTVESGESDLPLASYIYADFLLPPTCDHLSTITYCQIRDCGIAASNMCKSCSSISSLSEDFDTLLRSKAVCIVKPRYGFSHNTHLAYRFEHEKRKDITRAMTITNATRKSILFSDAWRMLKQGEKMHDAQTKVADKTRRKNECEEVKMSINQDLRVSINELKAGNFLTSGGTEVETLMVADDESPDEAEEDVTMGPQIESADVVSDDDEDWF